MALGTCRECGETVSDEAASCPHCGAPEPVRTDVPYGAEREDEPEKDVPDGPLGEGEPDPGKDERVSDRTIRLVVIGLAVLSLSIWVLANTGRQSPNATSTADTSDQTSTDMSGQKSTAWLACQEAVKKRLLSPATAHFPDYSSSSVRGGALSGQYVVVSHVDAENAFGALLRKLWYCTVTVWGTDYYRIDSLSIGDQ